jgi:hypothetical protein
MSGLFSTACEKRRHDRCGFCIIPIKKRRTEELRSKRGGEQRGAERRGAEGSRGEERRNIEEAHA